MIDSKSLCKSKNCHWTWEDKQSNIEVPNQENGEFDLVDINFFRCTTCGEIQAQVD